METRINRKLTIIERMFLDNGFNFGVSVFDCDDLDFACVLCKYAICTYVYRHIAHRESL